MSYTLTLMFRVSPSSMFEVGALEVKVLIWRAEQGAEQGGVKVELKVSTCACKPLHTEVLRFPS